MKHNLIQKIEQEQRQIEIKAIETAIKTLGVPEMHRKKIIDNYRWMLAVQSIRKEIATSRMEVLFERAKENYIYTLEQGLKEVKSALTVKHWNQAGMAMQEVYRDSFTRS